MIASLDFKGEICRSRSRMQIQHCRLQIPLDGVFPLNKPETLLKLFQMVRWRKFKQVEFLIKRSGGLRSRPLPSFSLQPFIRRKKCISFSSPNLACIEWNGENSKRRRKTGFESIFHLFLWPPNHFLRELAPKKRLIQPDPKSGAMQPAPHSAHNLRRNAAVLSYLGNRSKERESLSISGMPGAEGRKLFIVASRRPFRNHLSRFGGCAKQKHQQRPCTHSQLHEAHYQVIIHFAVM